MGGDILSRNLQAEREFGQHVRKPTEKSLQICIQQDTVYTYIRNFDTVFIVVIIVVVIIRSSTSGQKIRHSCGNVNNN